MLTNVIMISSSLLLLFHPVSVFVTTSDNLFLKSPSQWTGEDGQKYLHGRAVAPEYQKAFSYLNDKQKEGNIVIISDGSWYLNFDGNIKYYSI